MNWRALGSRSTATGRESWRYRPAASTSRFRSDWPRDDRWRSWCRATAWRRRLAPQAPGIFTYTYGETRSIDVLDGAAAIASNADGTLNYPSQPAHPGETITLRVTGLGEVDPRPAPLARGPREPAAVIRIPEVLIDGRSAVVQSAVLAAGEAGLYDVRVTIPRETRTGVRVRVQLRAGEILSNVAVLAIE